MRKYMINMSEFGISRWRYRELQDFCRQYPEKKAAAASLLGIRSSDHVVEYVVGEGRDRKTLGTVLPRGNATSNPVEGTMIKRLRLLEDCDLIDRVAAETDGGGWAKALILHCCRGKGYEQIDKGILPTSNRNAFFRAKREFFWRLDHERYKTRY